MKKLLLIFLITIMLIACGEESFIIGFTTIKPQNDVVPFCDIVEILFATEILLSNSELETRFGKK